jgi:hypothetical protein
MTGEKCSVSIERIRKLLAEYDRGEHSDAGLLGAVSGIFLDETLEAVQTGRPYYASFSSCCCSAHAEPERVTRVEIREGPHHVIFTKISE